MMYSIDDLREATKGIIGLLDKHDKHEELIRSMVEATDTPAPEDAQARIQDPRVGGPPIGV